MRRIFAIAALTILLFPPAVRAQECHLRRAASLDMSFSPTGGVVVPMKVDVLPVKMLVDTGGIVSMLNDGVVDKLKLRRMPMGNFEMIMFGGLRINKYVRPDEVQLDSLHAHDMHFAIIPDGFLPNSVDGTLAPDVMHNYDMDFDFAAGKLNLILQDHCPGKVVYWSQGPVAIIPIEVQRDGHVLMPVEIDGKPFKAALDTGSDRSIMSLDSAESLFGFDETSASLKALPHDEDQNTNAYVYPFKALTFNGVTVNNPDIVLVPDKARGIRSRASRLILGMGILRQLHLYIAYGEQKIYATPASAH